MKKFLLFQFLILNGLLITLAQPGQWTWMNGSSAINQAGSFGTQGTFAVGNTPPSLYEAVEWTDLNGNFWLFGGIDVNQADHSDLWEFSPTLNEWAWIKGPGIVNQGGVYGTQGVPAPANMPGARGWGFNTWVDTAGHLWLFGGLGYDANDTSGNLSDLWMYNIPTGEWTWMKGPNLRQGTGVFGTMTVEAAANNPPPRQETSASWTDNNNNLWMFGGSPGNIITMIRTLDDLWKFDIGTNNWAWMKGSQAINAPESYGTLGVLDTSNDPGGREVYAAWKDCNGDLWMFGGITKSSRVNNLKGDRFNDLWKFTIDSNAWTWIGGTNLPNDTGYAGTACIPGNNNRPSARMENRACWKTCCNHFINFGGIDSASWFNDLWDYNVNTGQWTLMSGSTTPNQAGNYGTITVSSPGNMPGSRSGVTAWKDLNGNLWLFGGLAANFTYFNDVWRYVVDTTCPALADSVKSAFAANPVSGCGPLTVTFNNSSTNGTYYTWLFGDGNASNASNPTNTYVDTGYYSVTLIASSSSTCGSGIDTAVIQNYIHVTGGPVVTASTNLTSFCAGDSTQICSDSGMVSYMWNNSDTTRCIEASLAGNYYVTVVDANGCTAVSNHLPITVNTPPPVTISANGDTLTAYDAVTYQWYFNDTAIAGATSQTYIATIPGDYTIMVTDSNGCEASSEPILISGIKNLCNGAAVSIYPNPNQTGSWQVAIANDLLGGVIEIFDDNGRLVYRSVVKAPTSTLQFNAESGVYILQIVSERYDVTRKLIKL